MSTGDLIRQLEQKRPPFRAKVGQLLHELREAGPDAVTLARARAAVEAVGLVFDPSIGVWVPRVGETYVLAVGGGGLVGQLRVARAGAAHARLLDGALARAQLHVIFEVLQRTLMGHRSGIPEVDGRGHRVAVSMPHAVSVDGDSLGAALSVALVSSWLDAPPRSDTAASAGVGSDGRLMAVTGLAEKLAALRRQYPAVRRLVVARDQAPEPTQEIELVRVENVEAALLEHGLALAEVRGVLDSGAATQAIEALHHQRVSGYDRDAWQRKAHHARWLAEQNVRPSLRTRALAYAGLFHLHAGEARDANALLDEIDDPALQALPRGVAVALRVNAAAAKIDEDPEAAVELASRALSEAERLLGDERSEWWGKAMGTYGRALLHAGQTDEALEPLGRAAEHHRQELPREAPQSLIHLATAQRRSGAPELGLDTVERAIAHPDLDDAGELFARYERARCRFALGDLEGALGDIEHVDQRQAGGLHYPRLGCLRYRVAIARRRGEDVRPWLLKAVDAVGQLPPVLREIAATALGEAMVVDQPPLHAELRTMVEAVWARVFGTQDIEETLASIVY